MNLIIFTSKELSGSSLILRGRRAFHIREVLRSKAGDTLRVGMLNGNIGTGRVRSIADHAVELEVSLPFVQQAASGIELVLAMPRPIMLKRILKQATVLGVDTFHLIRSKRVEKSFFQSSVLDPKKINAILLAGMEQAMITRLPTVHVYDRFRPFAEDILPGLPSENKFIAHPECKDSFAAVLSRWSAELKQTVLAVGPEGGWNDFEFSLFQAQGFYGFFMGPRILHVDAAVISLLAQLQFYHDLCSL